MAEQEKRHEEYEDLILDLEVANDKKDEEEVGRIIEKIAHNTEDTEILREVIIKNF